MITMIVRRGRWLWGSLHDFDIGIYLFSGSIHYPFSSTLFPLRCSRYLNFRMKIWRPEKRWAMNASFIPEADHDDDDILLHLHEIHLTFIVVIIIIRFLPDRQTWVGWQSYLTDSDPQKSINKRFSHGAIIRLWFSSKNCHDSITEWSFFCRFIWLALKSEKLLERRFKTIVVLSHQFSQLD